MNKYVSVPLILAAICVVSGGAIGGIHLLTSKWIETHKSTEAPEEIKALYSDGSTTFKEVEGFTEKTIMGASNKVTITMVYEVIRGGQKVGYAYMLNGGKPVKTEVLLTCAFEGDVSEDTASSFHPVAVNVYQAGDSGYEDGAIAIGSRIISGDYETTAGGTKSQRCVIDGVLAARTDYVGRWNGKEDGPADDFPAEIRAMYPNLVSVTKDESFQKIDFTVSGVNNGTGSVDELYRVELDNNVAFVYKTSGHAQLHEYAAATDPTTQGDVEIYWAYDTEVTAETVADSILPSNYKVASSTMSYDQWETTYLPELIAGTRGINDVSTGATRTSRVVRKMITETRTHYVETKQAELNSSAALYRDYAVSYGYAMDEGTPFFITAELA